MEPKGCPLSSLRGIRRNFFRLSPCSGQVSYVLLTRAPVAGRSIATSPLPLDLHVLSLSLAFILSQDQTLRCWLYLVFFFSILKRARQNRKFCLLLSRTCPLPLRLIPDDLIVVSCKRRSLVWNLTEILLCLPCGSTRLLYYLSLQIFQCSFAFQRRASELLCKVTDNFRNPQEF